MGISHFRLLFLCYSIGSFVPFVTALKGVDNKRIFLHFAVIDVQRNNNIRPFYALCLERFDMNMTRLHRRAFCA